MIQLPPEFDLSLFISEVSTLGIILVGIALAFAVFGLINKVLNKFG